MTPSTTPEYDDRALTDIQLAEKRNLSVHTLRADRRGQRRIPFVRLGRSIRYNLRRVDEALACYEVGGPFAKQASKKRRRQTAPEQAPA